jgi:hypothetical protein
MCIINCSGACQVAILTHIHDDGYIPCTHATRSTRDLQPSVRAPAVAPGTRTRTAPTSAYLSNYRLSLPRLRLPRWKSWSACPEYRCTTAVKKKQRESANEFLKGLKLPQVTDFHAVFVSIRPRQKWVFLPYSRAWGMVWGFPATKPVTKPPSTCPLLALPPAFSTSWLGG